MSIQLKDLLNAEVKKKLENIEKNPKVKLPKQKKEHGLKASQVKLSDKSIEKIIDEYTRESGVRTLDKRLAKICRWQAKENKR